MRFSTVTKICGYCGKPLAAYQVDSHMQIWHKNRMEVEDAQIVSPGSSEVSGNATDVV